MLALSLACALAGCSPGSDPPRLGLRLDAPPEAASGAAIAVEGAGATPGAVIEIEQRGADGWSRVAAARAGAGGRFTAPVRAPGRRVTLRARDPGPLLDGVSGARTVRRRALTIAALGDINLGDGIAAQIESRGARYPWSAVAPLLRRADLAFGNLECAISRRGSPVLAEFNFRGDPEALRATGGYAGLDVLNLANNHSADYGPVALLDTIRNLRRFGIAGVGAGRDLRRAMRPRIVRRLGLRIALVGFSEVLPSGFPAAPGHPGVAPTSRPAVRAAIRAADRRADLVIAAFHWGEEGDTEPNEVQRSLASAALDAGATAVIGAHPHVLQPLQRSHRRVVAFSLGNFVFNPSGETAILLLRLSARGVEDARLREATVVDGRPTLP